MADPKDKRPEDEKVTEAYENISAKLDKLRRPPEEDENEDTETDENTPKTPNLTNDLDDDPLDQEDIQEDEEVPEDEFEKEVEDEKDKLQQAPIMDDSPPKPTFQSSENAPDTLDDLANEQDDDQQNTFIPANRPTFASQPEQTTEEDVFSDQPQRPSFQENISSTHPSVENVPDEEGDNSNMHIPNLRPQMPVSSVVPGFQRGNLNKEPESFQNPNTFSGAQNFHNRQNFSNRKAKSSKLHLLILLVIGIVTIAATVYVLKYRESGISFLETASPSPSSVVATPEPTPTPTPIPTVDRSKFKVRVLNGTTKTGFAATISGKLKDLGYQTDKTGNATNSAFTQTVVRVKSSAKSILETLIKDLSSDLQAIESTPLKDSDGADAEVILGTK